jgi:hypothetical protein
VLVFVIIAAHFLVGQTGWQTSGLSMVDLMYAILFVMILRQDGSVAVQAA